MVAVASTRTDHRQRVLRALGVTPYRLRAGFRTAADETVFGCAQAQANAAPAPIHAVPACALVLPEHCDERERAQVDRIMRALGGVYQHAPRLHVVAGELRAPVPPAHAYLAFGEAQARALGRRIAADVMAQSEVLLLDLPEALFEAAGKRRLWQAVSGLRRHGREPPEPQE